MEKDNETLPHGTHRHNGEPADPPPDELAGTEKSTDPREGLTGSPQGAQQRSRQERTHADKLPDPFDPVRLRLSQDFASTIGVQKALLTVPVRKPSKEWWVQVHPDESYRIETAVLELKEDREMYLVDPSLWDALGTESTFGPRKLFTSMNRQGVLFVWPARLPGPDGKIDSWSRSALEAASMATGRWVRVAANMNLGAYEVFESTADLPGPPWPETKFGELLRVAFKDRFIDSHDHPVLRKLRGEV